MNANTHLFSLYAGSVLEKKQYPLNTLITLHSADLARRIFTVLRLTPHETIQLFSSHCVLTLILEASPRPKDTIVGKIIQYTPIDAPTRQQVACIGLLKKESFEEAVHHATVTGATTIIPCITQKSRKSFLSPREAERLTTIIIAACEQSKNYHIPTLQNPQPLETLLRVALFSIGFEAHGAPFTQALSALTHAPHSAVRFFIGPEGGFTPDEYTQMQNAGVLFYQLTPTILRSQEAVCLASGLISALRTKPTHSS